MSRKKTVGTDVAPRVCQSWEQQTCDGLQLQLYNNDCCCTSCPPQFPIMSYPCGDPATIYPPPGPQNCDGNVCHPPMC